MTSSHALDQHPGPACRARVLALPPPHPAASGQLMDGGALVVAPARGWAKGTSPGVPAAPPTPATLGRSEEGGNLEGRGWDHVATGEGDAEPSSRALPTRAAAAGKAGQQPVQEGPGCRGEGSPWKDSPLHPPAPGAFLSSR